MLRLITGILLISCCSIAGLHDLSAQYVRTHTDGSKIIIDSTGVARYFNTGEIVEGYDGSDDASAYPLIAAKIEPLSSAVDITEEDLRRIALRRLQLAEEAASLAEERAIAAADNRQRLETRLASARGSASGQAGQYQRQLQLARKIEIESKQEAEKARNRLDNAKSVIDNNRYVAAYNDSRQQRRARSSRGARNEEALPHARRLLGVAQNSFTGYGKSIVENTFIPQTPCTLAFEGPDETSGQYVRASEPELFFTHTDESLRPYLEGKEYLTAHAFVHSRGGYRYLTVRLTFANPNAITTYGFLNKGSLMSLHLLDGNFLNLKSSNQANGTWDEKSRQLYYEITYAIDRSMISSLRQSDLDYVQIFWSSGFEEYDVFQVDVLQRLLNCL